MSLYLMINMWPLTRKMNMNYFHLHFVTKEAIRYVCMVVGTTRVSHLSSLINMQINLCFIPGVLDTSTKEMMKRPRCGVKDDMQGTSDNAKRKKRYALHGNYNNIKLCNYINTLNQSFYYIAY